MSKIHSHVGCIGCGNIGNAILTGLLEQKEFTLHAYDSNAATLDRIVRRGVHEASSVTSLVEVSDIILLAVKPAQFESVLAEVSMMLRPDQVLVSLAAGINIDYIKRLTNNICPVVRTMPNTAAKVGAGIFALTFDDKMLSEEDIEKTTNIFNYIGTIMVMEEAKFHAFTAVAGCGPAYVFHFMDALAESAVSLGFTRSQAVEIVNSVFTGSAKLANVPGANFSILREQVCSPGGVTITAINHLDRTAVRGHIIDAVFKAYDKDKSESDKFL